MYERYRRAPYPALRAFCEAIFRRYGFDAAQSAQIADVLLTADLFSIESHGVQRLVRYDAEIQRGYVDVTAKVVPVRETALSAVLDAGDAMGQLAAAQAMSLAIQKAKASGIGWVALRHSNHFGIAGYYAHMAAREDLLGVCMTNSEAIMPPTNALEARLGTNPIAVAMPAEPTPFLFDASTTVVPRGRLEVYEKRGEPLPPGWAIDAHGRETRDPSAALDAIRAKRGGGILPLGGEGETGGGHKGYGLALLCELCTAIFSDGARSDEIYKTPGKARISQSFLALDYGLFGDKAAIQARFSALLADLRAAKPLNAQARVYVHGDKEAEAEARNRALGIPMNERTRGELREIALRLGVPLPDFLI